MKIKLSLLTETVKRFPAASLLAVANAVFIGWAINAPHGADHTPLAMLYASGLGIVLSAFVGLVAERSRAGRSPLPPTNYPLPSTLYSLSAQAVVLGVTAFLAWSFLRYDIFEQHFCFSYYLTLAAFAALTAWALGLRQSSERVFPCLVFAGIIGCTAAIVVGGGFSLVLLAIEKLFSVFIWGKTYGTIWGGAWATVGTLFFLAYATRREAFEFPKVWRVLFVYVTLPIYLILLAVLWAYLGKCVATWSLPNGQINWLVTLSVSIWMYLHLILGGIDIGLVRIFRRFGAFTLVPLVGLQICALNIRIAQYGLSPARYASILFVVFALAFAALSLVRRRWATPAAYVLLAALAVFAAHSHWNIVDTGVRSQLARLENFRARKAAGENFDRETRYAIMGTWEFMDDYTFTNGVYRHKRNWQNRNQRFKDEWGFNYETPYERRHLQPNSDRCHKYHQFFAKCGYTIDVASFVSCQYGHVSFEDARVKLNGKDGNFKDITDPFLTAFLQMTNNCPLVVDVPDVGRIVMINGSASTEQPNENESPKLARAYGDCLIFRK